MAYLGNVPAEAYSSIDKQVITGDGGASYTLDHSVANENEIEVFVNNVRQEPSVAYTVSGTALTMTGDVESSDDFYVVFQGKAIQTTSHPEGQDLKARDVTATGTVTANGLTLGDNDKAIFGAGNDLQVYHDGSDSIIKDTGTGNLKIQGSGQVRIEDASGNLGAVFNANTDAVLKYAGSNRLATTANGIATFNGTDVSMSAEADGQIKIDGNGYSGAIALDGSNMNIYTNSSLRGIVFGTNETERMRINASGSVNFNDGTTGTWKYLRENVSFPTNATYVDVTGIPSDAEEVQIIIYECDMANNDQKLQLRIGDSGGLETSGYRGGAQAIGTSWRNESSTRWFLVDDNVDTKFSGIIDLASMNGSNRWVMRSIITDPDSSGPSNDIAAGSKLVSGSLDRIRLYTESGNFTDGEYSVRYR